MERGVPRCFTSGLSPSTSLPRRISARASLLTLESRRVDSSGSWCRCGRGIDSVQFQMWAAALRGYTWKKDPAGPVRGVLSASANAAALHSRRGVRAERPRPGCVREGGLSSDTRDKWDGGEPVRLWGGRRVVTKLRACPGGSRVPVRMPFGTTAGVGRTSSGRTGRRVYACE